LDKLTFKGIIQSIQPRIRLTRSFDESSHEYLGYALLLKGQLGDESILTNSGSDRYDMIISAQEFSIGIGKAAHEKHQFKAGDVITGECVPVADERLETVEYYKVSKLKKLNAFAPDAKIPPPWEIIPPDLATYRERGPRRLAAQTYALKCITCIWGCRMPVEIIIDNWNPSQKEYRFETFCYGPLSCKFYKAGPNRKVQGRKGMVYIEEEWVDEEMTSHRDPDE